MVQKFIWDMDRTLYVSVSMLRWPRYMLCFHLGPHMVVLSPLLNNSAYPHSPLTICRLDRGCTIRFPICTEIDSIACVNAMEKPCLMRAKVTPGFGRTGRAEKFPQGYIASITLDEIWEIRFAAQDSRNGGRSRKGQPPRPGKKSVSSHARFRMRK